MSFRDKSGSHCSLPLIDQTRLTKCSCLCKVLIVFVVEHLNQQWIFPTFFIILLPYLSAAFCCSSVTLYPPRWAPSVPAGVSDVCLVCISLITVVLHQCTFWPFPHFFVFVVLSRRDVVLMFLLLKKYERQNTHPLPLFKQIAHIWHSCKMSQQIFNISLSVPMLRFIPSSNS